MSGGYRLSDFVFQSCGRFSGHIGLYIKASAAKCFSNAGIRIRSILKSSKGFIAESLRVELIAESRANISCFIVQL